MTETETPVRIIVDHREKPSGVPDHLLQHPDAVVEFRELPFGDYWVNGNLVVERKSLRDFAESIIDGRLFRQASILAQRVEATMYLLEGGLADSAEINMRREAMQGAIITLTMIYGFPLVRSLNPEESARLMLYAGRQLQRREKVGIHPGRKPKRKSSRQLRILQSLPGVGPERARLLLERFQSVEKAFQATPEELASVPGIGPKTAAAIRDVLE